MSLPTKKSLDARGKACFVPIVETKKLLKTLQDGDIVEVIVDNFITVQNIRKMAAQMNIPVSSEKLDEVNYIVILTVSKASFDEAEKSSEKKVYRKGNIANKTVVVISSEKIGRGDEKLGLVLMKGFIYCLTEQDILPETILLYNSGAKLSVHDSDSLSDLKFLESCDVEILTCGTSLMHYALAEKLGVGSVTNMYVIVEKQMQATNIIAL